ncbi:MAG: PspC domain-containing protein [Actinomycetota bacterium]|nr:PspC domain-containing protein [Actinomycetota bacterium]
MKQLRRSRKNRMIAGVCGGIAEWQGWDPTAVRVVFVLVSLFSAAFPGIFVYLILWLVIPEEGKE